MKGEIKDPSPNKIELTASEIVLLNAEYFASAAKIKRPFKAALFVLLLLVVSGWTSFYGINKITTAWSIKNWPTAEGEIIFSEVETKLMSDSSEDVKELFRIKIDFKYTVDNKVYHCDEVKHGSSSFYDSNKNGKMRIVETYPAGKIVTVFYNPESPSNSVLETGIPFNNFLIFIIGLALFIPSLFLLRKYSPLIFRKN